MNPRTRKARSISAARTAELKRALDALVSSRAARPDLDHDPLGLVHRYRDPADQEVVGLVAAMLAFGNVTAIRRKVIDALERLGSSPAQAIDALDATELARRFDGFVHRIYRGAHIARMLHQAAGLRRAHGSLGRALHIELETAGGDPREGLARFADALRGPDPDRGMRHLLSDPRSSSACKRWHLYLRWMVRPADGVDLGLWSLPTSILRIPLDTHVLRIAKNLGLTRREDASWRTADEVTLALAALDPADPVQYDFALCHLGVSRDCPRHRNATQCGRCVLHEVCTR